MRTVAVVTSSRADYSHLYWLLRALQQRDDFRLQLIAMGPHLSPEFGLTANQIEADGFPLHARIECLLSSDTDVGMAKTIGLATLSFADCLGNLRPDLLLLIADRFEMLAPASVALALRIPIAHIEGGEISEGAIDDAVRNALTKLSHLHFTSTATARQRVISMGEEPWRVHHAGAPSLDHIRRSRLLTRDELESKLQIRLHDPILLATLHPLTIAADTLREAQDFFAALADTAGQILFCYPNADAGSRALIDRAQSFVTSRPGSRLFLNLDPITYWSLLAQTTVVIGNSSSGVMEAASFGVPAVDIGLRQHGRERGPNVLHAEPDRESIQAAIQVGLSAGFRAGLHRLQNPYGDGQSGPRIASILASVPLGETLLRKRATEVQ